MPDYQEKRICGVHLALTGSFALESGYTDHVVDVGYDSKTFLSAPEVDFSKLATLTSGFEDEECIIKNIPAPAYDILTSNLRARYTYPEIEVNVYSWELNADDSVNVTSNVWHLWSGLVYLVKGHLLREYISIESRNDKYYADRMAGIACLEQCKCAYFGDAICGKAVTSASVTVNAITGYTVGFSSAPVGVDGLYRSGYISFNGLDIKVLEWSSATGTQATLALPAPSEWLNQTMTIYAGCDRTYQTCKNIHNNTENGLFLGINMVDYNTYYETG